MRDGQDTRVTVCTRVRRNDREALAFRPIGDAQVTGALRRPRKSRVNRRLLISASNCLHPTDSFVSLGGSAKRGSTRRVRFFDRLSTRGNSSAIQVDANNQEALQSMTRQYTVEIGETSLLAVVNTIDVTNGVLLPIVQILFLLHCVLTPLKCVDRWRTCALKAHWRFSWAFQLASGAMKARRARLYRAG